MLATKKHQRHKNQQKQFVHCACEQKLASNGVAMIKGKDIVKVTALATGAFVLKSAFSRLLEYDFKNKTVLITGGSRGLGLVLAREFAREGARIAICARDEHELERARIDLEKFAVEVMTVPCDITNKEEVAEMVVAINRRFGHIDVLVNNAGVIQVGPLEVMTHEDFELAMNAHFWAPLNTIMAVLPSMRQRNSRRRVRRKVCVSMRVIA